MVIMGLTSGHSKCLIHAFTVHPCFHPHPSYFTKTRLPDTHPNHPGPKMVIGKNVRNFLSILVFFGTEKMSEKWPMHKNVRKFPWFMFHDVSSPKCLIKIRNFTILKYSSKSPCPVLWHFYTFWSSFWHFSLWPSHFLIAKFSDICTHF